MPNIIENIGNTRWLEVHDRWRAWQTFGEPCDSAVTDCTHIAQFLGEDHIGPKAPEKRLVDDVNCAVLAQRAPHPFVHVAAR